ncbi:MAG: DUF4350 domain-containing protein [Bacteroidota bacterium]
MRSNRTYITGVCLAAMLLGFTACNHTGKPTMPSMYPPYRYHDKNPMGTNIAYRLLPQQFNGEITLASKKIKDPLNELSYVKGSVYLSIGQRMTLNNIDLGNVLSYVGRGNEFFIADNDIDYRLLDTLGVRRGTANATEKNFTQKRNTSLEIADSFLYGKNKYGFFYYPFADSFTAYDSNTTRVLGVNEMGHANYIVLRYGKGKFYFHAAPAAFSNYFLLKEGNTAYFSQALSYLNKDAQDVYWGDTDRFSRKPNDFSALAIFWNNPPLKYALLIACSLMLLYIGFGSKRKRRLVPVQLPNTNASLSFVQTIGNLYLQKKDNRNIAIKMMTYLLEHIRNSYHLATHTINAAFIQTLSRKSGMEEKKVQTLMEKADYINTTETITDQELLELNNLVHEFYKR